ncbi:MAG: sporulation YhaL family protein [Sporolactobacillus sp.]
MSDRQVMLIPKGARVMKQMKRSLYAVAFLFLLFLAQQFNLINPIISALLATPWWIYLVVAGILFSGWKAFTLMHTDAQIDEEWNEEQGDVFVKRMHSERERRHSGDQDHGRQSGDRPGSNAL